MIRGLVSTLAKRGHDVAVLTTRGPLIEASSIPVYTVAPGKAESPFSYEDLRLYYYTALFMIRSLTKLIKLWTAGIRFDVISVHFATEGLVAKCFSLFSRVPVVFAAAGYTPLEGRVAKLCDAVTVLSENDLRLYSSNHGLRPVLARIGFDFDNFPAPNAHKLPSGHPILRILCVCRLEPRKDMGTLLKAFALLKQRGVGFRATIVGTGISDALVRRQAHDLLLGDSVAFAGQVRAEDLPSYYRNADIFAMTPLYEGFGIVYLEAMAFGLPIVTTDAGASAEVVGDAGIVVEPQNSGAVADALQSLASNPSARSEFASRGLRRARLFSWDIVGDAYESVYLQTVATT